MIQFNCQYCTQRLEIDDSFAGQQAQCPYCQKPTLIPSAMLQPGSVLGNYLLEARIEGNATREVWRAKSIQDGSIVKIKSLTPQAMIKQDVATRFTREVRNASQLKHPALEQGIDHCLSNGTHFLVLTHNEGISLQQFVKQNGPLDEKETLRMALTIGDALKYAWEEYGIIHRNIKPAKILRTEANSYILLDMGLSKSVSPDELVATQDGAILGTPSFMSPEQLLGRANLDCRTDIYSLGSTMYHAITGKAPFSVATRLQQLDGNEISYKNPQELNPSISENMRKLLDTMMSDDLEIRQHSWKSALSDITLVSHGFAIGG